MANLLSILRLILGWLFLIIGLYFLAALIGGLIGVNSTWREPENGVEIFIETNGVHTAIILPRRHKDHNWSDFLPASDLPDGQTYGQNISFSWGERNFFLKTENWSDLKPSIAAKAIFGSNETLMHVYHYGRVRDGEYARSLIISEQQHKQLIALIKKRFASGPQGRAKAIKGYGSNDIFYPATGYYSPFRTCNVWTSETLSEIGVTTGIWTPMAGGVMRWFPQNKAKSGG
jgi:uncharacterized protein (TIGR02117 family)